MAIRSRYAENNIVGGVGGKASSQPGAFRATGKGWFNKLPDFPATVVNANASIINRALDPSAESYKLYLFVNAIQTGWSLAGETAQGPMGRVFYPRNLTQDEFAIEGITANQFEYDRIVQFVEFHQRTQMLPQTTVPINVEGDSSYTGVDFRLFKPMAGATLDAFKPLRYLVLVTDVAAGHERFLNYPTYSLLCKVAYDYLGSTEEIDLQIDRIVSRQEIFGDAVSPPVSTGNSPLQNIAARRRVTRGIGGGSI